MPAAALLAAAALAAVLHAPHDPISVWVISPDFANDRTLYVGQNSFGLVLRSTDGGETFESVNAGFDTAYVSALAISPDFARDRTLAAVDNGRPYLTTDGGTLWTRLADAPAGAVTALAFSPAYGEDRTLVLGTAKGQVHWSPAADGAWRTTPLPAAAPVTRLAFAADGALVAVTGPKTLHVSADRGATWRTAAAPPVARIHAVLADDARTLRLGTDRGLLRSTDGGATWAAQPGPADVLDLAAAPDAQGTALFAATARDGVHVRPGDAAAAAGGGWTVSREGLREPSDQSDVHYLGVMPSPGFAQDGTIYTATFEGLHVSTDRGRTWRWLKVLPERFARAVTFSPRFADDGTLLVSTYGLGLLRTRDRGASWERLETNAWEFPDAVAVAPAAGAPPPVAAGAGGASGAVAGGAEDGASSILVGSPTALMLSRDAGASFRDVLPGQRGFAHVAAFAPDYAASGTIYVHTLEFGAEDQNDFLRSDDRGASWTRTGPRTIHGLAFAPDFETSGRMYVATPGDVQVSRDRGRTWTPLPGLPRAMYYDVAATRGPDGADGAPAVDRLLAVSPMAGTYLSVDGGASWRRDDEGLSGARATAAAFSPAHATDGREYLLTQFEGLFARVAGETTWRRLGLRGEYALRLSLSPDFARDRALAVAGYGGPWLSTDAGATFTRLDIWAGRPGTPPPRVGKGLVAVPTGAPPKVAAAAAALATASAAVTAPAAQDGSAQPATSAPQDAPPARADDAEAQPEEPEPWTPGLMTWVLAGLAGALAIRLGAWAARRRHAAR